MQLSSRSSLSKNISDISLLNIFEPKLHGQVLPEAVPSFRLVRVVQLLPLQDQLPVGDEPGVEPHVEHPARAGGVGGCSTSGGGGSGSSGGGP